MADSLKKRLESAFGWERIPRPLVYGAPNALRFDLGGDEQAPPVRFLRVIDRARQVCTETFARSANLTALIGTYDGERRSSRPARSFKALTAMGFRAEFGPAERTLLHDADHIATFGYDLCEYWRCCEFANEASQLDILLWASIARKMPVLPKARWLDSICIADFDRRILLVVYDDRGMDLCARNPESIRPIYTRFSDWLLDHDRVMMDARFA